jgi:GTP1/Obg family GTP-binding protein
MIDKIKSLWGSSTLDRDEYEKAMANMRAQEARRQMDAAMMNSAQNAAQQSALHNPYLIKDSKYGRGMLNSTAMTAEETLVNALADTNRAMTQMAERLAKQERRIDMLSGFYTWITDVHPEIAAQHKAMRDLYEAANAPQEEKAS